jgi:hypothetical protein
MLEIALFGGFGSGSMADHLAVIAAEHPVADWCAQIDGDS